jgi:uncharacterized OB-fold protein
MSDARKIPAPTVSPETREFWEAAAAGRLLVKHCRACGEAHWYPRAHCPFCFSDATEWRESAGRGTIYSYSVMRRAAAPYAIAYVTLDEGVTMLTNIVDCDLEKLRIGQKVRAVFRPVEGGALLPMFTPL